MTMSHVTLEQVYYISQIVAAIAIVGSLLFVGVQLLHNERMQRATIHQRRADRIIELMSLIAQPHMSAMLAKVRTNEVELTREEFVQLDAFVRMIMTNFEDTEWQTRVALLDALSKNANRTMARNVFAIPAVRAWWRVSRDTLYPGVVELVERELLTQADSPFANGDPHARWREAMAAMLAADTRQE